MKPYYQDSAVTLWHGDCRAVLGEMPDNSVDSVVCDPPYGLSFMGKKWDYDVPSEDIWRECLRVLKPGGHLLAFAGTRTQHRMAVRIEDAGFEIRDMIAWVYGSGFPKSFNIGKQLDKLDAVDEQQARRYRFTEWVRAQGVSSAQIDKATGTNMGSHYTTLASQPAIMTREHLEACRHLFNHVPEWVEREADIRSVESKNFAEREVVGKRRQRANNTTNSNTPMNASAGEVEHITAPATEAAKQWEGWGTALKPAMEPITVARKPFPGTVAANVLEWGTGAINVDGCRVGVKEGDQKGEGGRMENIPNQLGENWLWRTSTSGNNNDGKGRWPANLIHSGEPEVVGLFPETTSRRTARGNLFSGGHAGLVEGGAVKVGSGVEVGFNDSGSAARFFYCAKASKRDRDEGCGGLEAKTAGDVTGGRKENSAGLDCPRAGAGRTSGSRNHHPTVKPTSLMIYLCRLVTPPGGIVLDPFMGSGSTGKAAVLEGFSFIGIEREANYLEIAKARIAHAQKYGWEPDPDPEPEVEFQDEVYVQEVFDFGLHSS